MTGGIGAAKIATVESTYKAHDVESVADIYFYRPVGFQLARFFAALRFSPSMVSLLGAAIGVGAGHLYFYRDLRLNLIGMLLHLLSNALDNADGQLARLTNRGSLQGAIVDGFADYAVFLSVYIHLALRFIAEGGSSGVWLLVLGAGLSHAAQSMTIDHYRNAYLQFVAGKRSADANSSEEVGAALKRVGRRELWKRFSLWSYLGYARRQELLAPTLLKLRRALAGETPTWFAEQFRAACRPLVKWCNCLATNPRMMILFAVILLGRPVWYFVIEMTVLNLLLLFVILRHESIFRSLLAKVRARSRAPI